MGKTSFLRNKCEPNVILSVIIIRRKWDFPFFLPYRRIVPNPNEEEEEGDGEGGERDGEEKVNKTGGYLLRGT